MPAFGQLAEHRPEALGESVMVEAWSRWSAKSHRSGEVFWGVFDDVVVDMGIS